MDFTLTFIELFAWSLYLVGPILLILTAMIVFFGQIVRALEGWTVSDALYWSFVTATTVGYGDIRPMRKVSRLISIFIALQGILLTGIILAAAVKTLSISLEMHIDPAIIEKIDKNVRSE